MASSEWGSGSVSPSISRMVAKLAEASASPSSRSNICGKEPCRARFAGETTPVSMMVILGMEGNRSRSAVIACDKRDAFAQGSEATKQSILPLCGVMDCFAPLACTNAPRLLQTMTASPASADDDFADLHDRRDVGIVLDVAHDLLGVRPEAGLERLDRVGEDMTHADIGRRRAGGAAAEALVDGV